MVEALPDLALVAAALLLVLIAGALWVLAKLLGDFLGQVPVIGSWVKRNIAGGLNDAANYTLHAAGSAWDAAKHLFDWVGNTVTRCIAAITHFTLETELTLENIVFSQLPALERRVEGVALNWVTSAVASLTAGYRAAVRVVSVEVGLLAARITAVEIAAFGQAARAEAAAVSIAHGLVTTTVTDLDTAADDVVQVVWPDAVGDIAGLRGAIGGDFPWLNDLLGALGGLGTVGIVGALTRALAGAEVATRLATDCTVPNCRNLSGLGNDLSNLLSDASTAAMLAWLIFGVTDPAGWAQETYDVAGPVASGLAHAGTTLFGG